jgi:hypothetical protein
MCSELEKKYPHVIEALKLLWPSDLCDQYLNSLVIADRPNRNGFSKKAIEELLTIQRILSDLLKSS